MAWWDTNSPFAGAASAAKSEGVTATNEMFVTASGDVSPAPPDLNPADLPTEERASLLEAERILVDYISL